MKTSLAILFAFPLLAGCGGSTTAALGATEQALAGPKVRNTAIVHIPLFVRDASGNIPTDPSALIFEVRKGNPVLAPDGHQLTLAEFNAPQGRATVKCARSGTRASLKLSGLVPNGVYTVWNVVFKAPGFDPTFANLIGLGALGESDGSDNSFVADEEGEGEVSAVTPGGPLSVFGQIAACALTVEFEFHVVGAYHIDGQTHGPTLGPAGSAVEQFGFIFRR